MRLKALSHIELVVGVVLVVPSFALRRVSDKNVLARVHRSADLCGERQIDGGGTLERGEILTGKYCYIRRLARVFKCL